MITLGKPPTLANRRLAFNRLRDRGMVTKLFAELGPRYAKRNGGYLRILKYGFRKGDNAPMAMVELVDRGSEADADATVENKAAAPKAKASRVADQGRLRPSQGFAGNCEAA